MWARVFLCAALILGACNKVTYVNPGTMPSGQVESTKGWYFVIGLVGHKDVWADRMCPGGVHLIKSKFSFLDLLITGITFGIVTPRTYVVHCAGGGQ